MKQIRFDKQKTYDEHIRKTAEYIKDAVKRTGEFKVLEEISTVLVAGSGVNSLAGELLKTYLGSTVRLGVVSGFDLPLGDKKTLVFLASYSGNDAEALSVYRAALKKGCRIVGITSGGELKKSLERNIKEHVILPSDIPENAALPYMFFSMLKILQNSGLAPNQDAVIRTLTEDLNTPYQTTAQQFVENLKGKIVLIYASQKLMPVARRWKMQLNAVARVPAFCSPMDANELNSFGNMLANFHVIMLKDANDGEEVIRQMDAMKQGLRQLNISSTEIVLRKRDMLTKLFSAVYMGDWIAYYLSLKYK